MSQFVFGSGLMFAKVEGGTQLPIHFGALQEVSLDFNASLKELHGSYQSPIAIARGVMKISGKAKMGQFQASVIRDLFFQSQSASGQVKVVNRDPYILNTEFVNDIPAPTVKVTIGNGANFYENLGVIYADTGLPLTIASNPTLPAMGSYHVNAATGEYTFNGQEHMRAIAISYAYTDSSQDGQIVTLSNQLLGQQPVWSLVLSNEFQGKQLNIKMNRCVASKFTFANKLEDFNTPDFEFGCFADDANNIGTMWLSEKS